MVSLILLGDENASEEYIQLLILGRQAGQINRGFHLVYYGDRGIRSFDEAARGRYPRNDDLEVIFDPGEENWFWSETFDARARRIVQEATSLELVWNDLLIHLNVFTLISFALSREGVGLLDRLQGEQGSCHQ